MSYLVYINGNLVPAEQAKISVFDAAYLYGEGLFETLSAIDSHVLFLKDHLQRLYRGARALKIPIPLTQQKLEIAVHETLRANQLRDAYLRINISAEESDVGKRHRCASEAHVVIFAKPPDPYPQRLYQKGCRLILIRSVTNDSAQIATLKTTNYLAKVVARREIATRGADEGILLNAKGFVTECAGSNLFLVKRNTLITPALEEGVMPGVTRKKLLQLIRRKKIPCQEKRVSPKQLERADEIFITSTLKGVMPVAQLERGRIGQQVPGPITQQMMEAYQKLIGKP